MAVYTINMSKYTDDEWEQALIAGVDQQDNPIQVVFEDTTPLADLLDMLDRITGIIARHPVFDRP